MNKYKLWILLLLFFTFSCKKTDKNKFYINSIHYECYNLIPIGNYTTNGIYYKSDAIYSEITNEVLVILTFNKNYYSDNPNKAGYPIAGMDGKGDIIIGGNLNFIYNNIKSVLFNNPEHKKDIIGYESHTKILRPFSNIERSYNLANIDNLDNSYAGPNFSMSIIINKEDYRKLISKKSNYYLKTRLNGKVRIYH